MSRKGILAILCLLVLILGAIVLVPGISYVVDMPLSSQAPASNVRESAAGSKLEMVSVCASESTSFSGPVCACPPRPTASETAGSIDRLESWAWLVSLDGPKLPKEMVNCGAAPACGLGWVTLPKSEELEG